MIGQVNAHGRPTVGCSVSVVSTGSVLVTSIRRGLQEFEGCLVPYGLRVVSPGDANDAPGYERSVDGTRQPEGDRRYAMHPAREAYRLFFQPGKGWKREGRKPTVI